MDQQQPKPKRSVEEKYNEVLTSIQIEKEAVDAIKTTLYGKFLSAKAKADKPNFTTFKKTLEAQNLKIQDLVRKAVRMQYEHPSKNLGDTDITLPTTIEEDLM